MIRAIIIDDETLARELLKEYITEMPDIQVIAECSDGFSGLKAIQELDPDLIFLDIQMPKLTGFEMLEVLDKKPEIIFCTAFDQYAIKAFEMNAIDYLLKPFSKERFGEAVEKAVNRLKIPGGDTLNSVRMEDVKKQIEESVSILNRLVVKNRNSIVVIPVHQIHYMEAQDDYVMIYCNGAHYLKQKTLSFYEKHLDPAEFVRVHRSYLLNLSHIAKIEPYEKSSYIVILKSGEKVPVSRTGYSRLKELINS